MFNIHPVSLIRSLWGYRIGHLAKKVGVMLGFLYFSFGFIQSAIAGFPGEQIKIQNSYSPPVDWHHASLWLYDGVSVDPTTGGIIAYGWGLKENISSYYNANVAVWYCQNGDWHLHITFGIPIRLETGTDLPGETVDTLNWNAARQISPTGSCVKRDANNGSPSCPTE